MRDAVANFKRIADDVGARRADIDQAVSDFTEMGRKLNLASSRVDGILAKVDGMLGTDDANSLFAKARETLTSFKAVADNLNARIGPIADNLTRFSRLGPQGFPGARRKHTADGRQSQQRHHQYRPRSAAVDLRRRNRETI